MTKIGFPQRNTVVIQGDPIPVISSHSLSWHGKQEPNDSIPHHTILEKGLVLTMRGMTAFARTRAEGISNCLRLFDYCSSSSGR